MDLLTVNQLQFYLNYYLELIVGKVYFPITGGYLLWNTIDLSSIIFQQFILLCLLYLFFHYQLRWEKSRYNQLKHHSNRLVNLLDLINNVVVILKIGFIINFSYYLLFKLFNLIKFLIQFSVFKEYLLIRMRLNHLDTFRNMTDGIDWSSLRGRIFASIGGLLGIGTEGNWSSRIHESALRWRLDRVRDEIGTIRYSLMGLILSVGPISLYIVRGINYLLSNHLGWGVIRVNVYWTVLDILNSIICFLTGNKTLTINLFSRSLNYWNWFYLFDKTFLQTRTLGEIPIRALFDCLVLLVRYDRHGTFKFPLSDIPNSMYGILSSYCYYRVGIANSRPLTFLLSLVEVLVKTNRIYNLYLHFKPTLIIHLRQISGKFDHYMQRIQNFFKLLHGHIMNNPLIKFNIESNPNLYWIQSLHTIYLKNESKLTEIQDRVIVTLMYLIIAVLYNRRFYFPVNTRFVLYSDIREYDYRTILANLFTYTHGINPNTQRSLQISWLGLKLKGLPFLLSRQTLEDWIVDLNQGLTPLTVSVCNRLSNMIIPTASLVLSRNINYLWLILRLLKWMILLNPILSEQFINYSRYLISRIREFVHWVIFNNPLILMITKRRRIVIDWSNRDNDIREFD